MAKEHLNAQIAEKRKLKSWSLTTTRASFSLEGSTVGIMAVSLRIKSAGNGVDGLGSVRNMIVFPILIAINIALLPIAHLMIGWLYLRIA
jgi:hypothetical protein